MRQDRQIPYAVMNYREVVEGKYFFVDHTRFLLELERYKTPVFLRPKRFGKSLWVSLLEHYYDIRFKGEFQKLFGKTDVGREPTPLAIPNLTIRNMFVDYYDELMAFDNYSEAMRHFGTACAALVKGMGTWREVFAVWWDHYVKARIPAQSFDKMNENFFRTTFASRCMDAMPMEYSVWSEFNVPAGRIDFLASPKPGTGLRARLIEFKYVTCAEADRTHLLDRAEPDADVVRQARAYQESLRATPNWPHGDDVDVSVVEIAGNRGYRWFDLQMAPIINAGVAG